MGYGKDSVEVVDFLRLFADLRGKCNENPGAVFQLAVDDEKFEDLCIKLAKAAQRLRRGEGEYGDFFAAPVDPSFLSDWRLYERHFQNVIEANWDPLVVSLVRQKPTVDKSKKSTTKDRRKERFEFSQLMNADLREETTQFLRLYDFGEEMIYEDWPLTANEGVNSLIDHWENLPDDLGLDLVEVNRRRHMLPFVLIPRHVSNHHGEMERLSLLTNLREAQHAFVFGLHFAALAMMRSVLEVTLKKHYPTSGTDLEQLIDNCESLPNGFSRQTLHRIRLLTNDILHMNNDKRFSDDFVAELARLLNVLRILIEEAPSPQRG
jgi:hypothetical protein